MGNIAINDVSVVQLLAMGDGLIAKGETRLARQIYQAALERSAEGERRNIRTRLGIASAPRSDGTTKMMKMLTDLESWGFKYPFVSEGMATWFKTLPFDDDPKFLALADKHSALLPIPNWHWNLQTALWAVKRCRAVPGDYVELGVFKGHTTLFCSEYVGFQDWPREWWLYDTFEGIPVEQQAPGWEARNKVYQGTYSHEEVVARFAAFPNIKVIKGRVPDVLEGPTPSQIAFMHIDLNNAPAEIGALEILFNRVSPGGIVLLDDYCWSTCRAQHDAEKAWFGARGLEVLPFPTGQGLLIKT